MDRAPSPRPSGAALDRSAGGVGRLRGGDQGDEFAGCRMWVADTEPGGVVRVAVPELRQLFSIPGDELETVAPTLWPPDRAFYGGGVKLTERNAHFQLTTQREVG